MQIEGYPHAQAAIGVTDQWKFRDFCDFLFGKEARKTTNTTIEVLQATTPFRLQNAEYMKYIARIIAIAAENGLPHHYGLSISLMGTFYTRGLILIQDSSLQLVQS